MTASQVYLLDGTFQNERKPWCQVTSTRRLIVNFMRSENVGDKMKNYNFNSYKNKVTR